MTPTERPTDWPAPAEILNPDGRSCMVLLCEHASHHIPDIYDGLGLESADLRRHIAWDIGAAQVTRALAKRLDAAAFLGTYSRLLIDLNRAPGAPTSIVARSEATDIPGNAELPSAERDRRENLFFTPFHRAVDAHYAARKAAGLRTFNVSIHSFTPVFLENARPWHVGVLFEQAKALGEATVAALARESELTVGANVPYTVSLTEDYGLLVYGDRVGNPAILIEIRQDLIARDEDAERWGERLARVLSETCR